MKTLATGVIDALAEPQKNPSLKRDGSGEQGDRLIDCKARISELSFIVLFNQDTLVNDPLPSRPASATSSRLKSIRITPNRYPTRNAALRLVLDTSRLRSTLPDFPAPTHYAGTP